MAAPPATVVLTFRPPQAFTKPYYEKAAERLNKHLSGNLTLVATDINAMLQLCSYETDALGYSSFCPLFTEDEFRVYEQAYDIQFAGNNGFQSPVSAAQGKAYLEELISRLNHSLITEWDSATNATQDGNEETFPLNQSLYADAAHEVSIMDALTALNLTALTGYTDFPPVDKLSTDHVYGASRVVPFGTQFQLQVRLSHDGAEPRGPWADSWVRVGPRVPAVGPDQADPHDCQVRIRSPLSAGSPARY